MKRNTSLLLAALLLGACARPSLPPLSEDEQAALLGKGKSIAQQTGAALVSKLQQALAAGGPEAAIGYCQLQALPITDSLARASGAQIRRTALRWRNPANAPSPAERAVLEQFLAAQAAGSQPEPLAAALSAREAAVYIPIFTLQPCEACHGAAIAPETEALIRRYYPEDQATGFRSGSLRGMWSLRLPRRGE